MERIHAEVYGLQSGYRTCLIAESGQHSLRAKHVNKKHLCQKRKLEL